MALMKILRPLDVTAAAGGVAASVAPAEELAAATTGGSEKPLTRPEGGYIVAMAGLLVVGAIIGIVIDKKSNVYNPPDGVSIFAVLFIVAQTLERLLEPIASLYGTTKADPAKKPDGPSGVSLPSGRVSKSQAVKARDQALALCLASSDAANAEKGAKAAAWSQELVDQIRRNTATIWALASFLGMIAAGWFGLLLLHAVNAPRTPRWLDIIITGIAIGGGSKPLHDLIQNIQASKEQKQNPSEATT